MDATTPSAALVRPFLECIHLGKRFHGRGGDVEALRDVNLVCRPGEFICLLGASGCGKSTLLQIVAGLERATEGHVVVSGREIDGPSRDLAFVFQDHGLFPWLTVERNVAFNLKARGVRRAERQATAARFLDMVGLGAFAKRYPHELSGGMKQRVGIARALTTSPKLLLMDEPFGALDTQTRANLQSELLRIWQATGTTVLFVTHSIDEAAILADRVVVFHPRPGRIRAVVPVELARPRDVHAPEFAALCRELEGLVAA